MQQYISYYSSSVTFQKSLTFRITELHVKTSRTLKVKISFYTKALRREEVRLVPRIYHGTG